MSSDAGRIAALFRHPVKGFTPERLALADLAPGAFFPCDRIYAVEDGPSGFDPDAPAFVPKTAFTVLAKLAAVAKARTRYDEQGAILEVEAEGRPPLRACLAEGAGREAFAAWLTETLGEEASGPLKVVSAAGHRFTDHPQGHVSVINLASVRELGRRMGRALDPLRFRANIHVEGWPAWAENECIDRELCLGAAKAVVFKPITRCAATGVDPSTGARDLEVPKALFEHFGHLFCGVYVKVTRGGRIAEGDVAALPPPAGTAA